jgi:hypothetical protein
MISDVLSEAYLQIQSYLDDPVYAEVYSGELRAEIERVMGEMQSLRERLDRLPPQAEQQNSG